MAILDLFDARRLAPLHLFADHDAQLWSIFPRTAPINNATGYLQFTSCFLARPDTDHQPTTRNISASLSDQSRKFLSTTTSMVKAEALPTSLSPSLTQPQKLPRNRMESR